MVALFLVVLLTLLVLVGCSLIKVNNKLKSDIFKCSEELKKCVEERDAMKCKLGKKKASKKRAKNKSQSLKETIKGKEDLIRVLEEQLAIAQSTDRGLREANLRLSNQLGEANSLITELRGEW